MNYLINTPLADPTQCYTSLPLLKGYLESKNISITVVDLNAVAHDVLIHKKKYGQQMLSIFRTEKSFYNQSEYQIARNLLKRFYEEISIDSKSYLLSNNSNFHKDGPWNLKKIKKFCDKKQSVFHEIYTNFLSQVDDSCRLIGLSCTFVSQLPEVFYFASLIKKHNPHIHIIIGGPLIGQVVAMLTSNEIKALFEYFDTLCVYEGESALATLIPLLGTAQLTNAKIPNCIRLQNGKLQTGERESLDLETLPPPDFSDIDFAKYLAPSKIILYSPSRGCYWNRCSFCHYGFNQHQSIGFREQSADKVVSDLITLKSKYGVENFYFSCDVLSPKFMNSIAEKILEKEIKIFWSTDIRAEKSYTQSQCNNFYKAGLVSVAFGMESGCNRVLEIMDKGMSSESMSQTSDNFFNAGIATGWMMFNYHPGENYSEAIESLNLILKHQQTISYFIVGEFGLTSGSKIFHNYKSYSLKEIFYHPDDFFKLYPYYHLNKGDHSLDSKGNIDKSLAKLCKSFLLDSYPFAGAISTHHSFLYFKKFGNGVFNKLITKKEE